MSEKISLPQYIFLIRTVSKKKKKENVKKINRDKHKKANIKEYQ